MSDPEAVSRWSRRFVLTGAGFLVAWQALALAGAGRRVLVVLGLYGFVLHTAFGKAFSLVPSYFERDLAVPRAMPLVLGLSVPAVALLAADAAGLVPVGAAGGVLWAGAVAAFVGALGWTVRDNPTGAQTGTGEANADRRWTDRAANAGVPVALAYLAWGTYETLAVTAGLPSLVGRYPPRVTHLLAAGFAAMLVFAVGFRLLPRFLVAHPPRALVAAVLPAGALGPAFLATGIPDGDLLVPGAILEAVAVVGFALAYAALFVRSDRDRVGLYGVLAGVAAGSAGVLLGLWFAFVGRTAAATLAHLRLGLLGFLGLTIVGAAYQFYPPAVGTFPGAGDRTALASIAALAGGLAVEVVGLLAGAPVVVVSGRLLGLAGALAYAWLLVGLFRERF